MSLNLVTALRLSWDGETGDAGNEPEPTVIALVDQRGRRMPVPVRGRLMGRRPSADGAGAGPAILADADFFSGTVH